MSKSGWGNKGTNKCLFLERLSLGSLGAEHKTDSCSRDLLGERSQGKEREGSGTGQRRIAQQESGLS